ncbi:MAG: energy-coupling factor transporter transmembrane component T [Candidatus Marinimicrobia bacterium]|nr:energy-coupling factor transporter transmembrane component T [Candidatus Neomarinimicrobiota bacterium]MDD5581789.1 energy-coupling factor transporter transmembrane component T [Candidatus Neomarinimicrobiota bacterium]
MKTFQKNFLLLTFFLVMLVAVWFPGLVYQAFFFLVLLPFVFFAPSPRKVVRFLLTISPFILLTLCVHLFFRMGTENYWEAFREKELWFLAGYFTLRNVNVMVMMALLFNYKPFPDIDGIMSKLQNRFLQKDSPRSFSSSVFIGLHYFRVIRDEYQSLMQVHRILGVRKEKGLFKQARYYVSLIAPLFVGSFERIDHLSVALTSRGFGRSTENA